MATIEEKVEDTETKSLCSQDNEDSVDSSPRTYVHNPEEFIDIHGSHLQKVAHCSKKDINNSMTVQNDLDLPQRTMKEGDGCESSKTGQSTITGWKVPVQVSEESDASERTADRSKHCDSSDEEYQSADDGEDDSKKIQDLKTTPNGQEFVEEEESDDDFIPVGEEEKSLPDEDDKSAAREERSNIAEDDTDEENDNEKEPDIIDDLEIRRKQEESLTEEERQERKERGQNFKDDGNAKFREGEYDAAVTSYTEALHICPLNFLKERSIMYSNRAACMMKKDLYNEAIKDCSSALDLHPQYLKALLRRAELYEKTEKLDEALKDYQKVLELDPSLHSAKAACVKLADQIKDRNEKMKEEMMGKLKDLGNMVLRPFGLSVNNFRLEQDPGTGSYSVQFQQNPPKNGS